jgi:hypothetical protein
MHTTTEIKDL